MSAVRATAFYNSSIEAVKDIEDDATIMFGGDGLSYEALGFVCNALVQKLVKKT